MFADVRQKRRSPGKSPKAEEEEERECDSGARSPKTEVRAELEVIGAATPKKRSGKGRNMKWEDKAGDRGGDNRRHPLG